MKRTFVAVITPYDRGGDTKSLVRLINADSVVEVIKRLVDNSDLAEHFAEELMPTTPDAQVIEEIENYNGDGADLLILDEFTAFDPDATGTGERLIGPE